MDHDSAVVMRAVSAVSDVQRRLLTHVADVYARGTVQYSLRTRHSLNRMSSLPDPPRSIWTIGEVIVLDEARDLAYSVTMFFGPETLAVAGGIVVTAEAADGYADEEILTLPLRESPSLEGFLAAVEEYVGLLCGEPGILAGIAWREPSILT
jgi:hypothetical protein